jgi:phosphatidylcholine synthase
MVSQQLNLDQDQLRTARAWLVHAYTATGLIATFFAMRALLDGRPQAVFVFLGAALFIDATDGPFARRWDVKRWTPDFSGRKLDDIVDYINYTLIPVIFAYHFGLAEGAWAAALPLVLIASAYGFCRETAKTDDGYFTGFPSYWNLLVFYLYLWSGPSWLNAGVLTLFAVLVWVPIKYVTWKTEVLQKTTLIASLAWGVALLMLLVRFEEASALLIWTSLLYPLYHFGLSFYLHFSGHNIEKVNNL